MIIKRKQFYAPASSDRMLHIYLPDNYDAVDERYPVMYFFDGHNLFFDEDATYGKSWGLKEFLDHWGKKMIIVGIECTHVGNDRLFEYLPYPSTFKMLSGKPALGDATLRWIIDEVKPMIDREYRTYPDRACTGIAGSSMGGLMALCGAARYNRIFSKAACVSPSLGFCFPAIMREMKTNAIDADTRVFLSFGTLEARNVKDPSVEDHTSGTYRRNKAAANKFASFGAAVELYCQVGGAHCEADWEKQVPRFMDFLWMH